MDGHENNKNLFQEQSRFASREKCFEVCFYHKFDVKDTWFGLICEEDPGWEKYIT